MNAWRNGLAALLAVQLVLTVGLFAASRPDAPAGGVTLLDFAPEAVTRLVIADGTSTVEINKTGDGWQLPGLEGLPADAGKVADTLQRLHDLKTSWPVATTVGAQSRFEVADDKYQRRLQLYSGDTVVAELYLGTSPGFRKVHTRAAGDNNIYALELNTFDYPVSPSQWLDKSLLAVSGVTEITGPDYVLRRGDGLPVNAAAKDKDNDKGNDKANDPANDATTAGTGDAAAGSVWQVSGRDAASFAPADDAAVDALLTALGGLRVWDLAAAGVEVDWSQAATLELRGDKVRRLQLAEQDGKYYARRDDIEHVFTLGKTDFDRIAAKRFKDFVAKAQSESAPEG